METTLNRNAFGEKTRNGDARAREKKATRADAGEQYVLIRRKISAGSQSYMRTRGESKEDLSLLLSRLANVYTRASRSAICQTRLEICTVGSPVIITEAYRRRGKKNQGAREAE